MLMILTVTLSNLLAVLVTTHSLNVRLRVLCFANQFLSGVYQGKAAVESAALDDTNGE